MSSISRFSVLLCTVFAVGALATPAQANYFVWEDAKTGATLTYPDTWRMINNQQPDDLVTIIGPSQDDRPICRLRARGDNRFTVYPTWYSAAVQRVAYNEEFWNEYLGEFDNVQIHTYRRDAAIGKAFASMVVASYTEAGGADHKLYRTSQAWGGVYHDTAYILDCSSTNSSYSAWQPDFAAIANSVDMRKVMHEFVIGNYPRNFITEDGHLTHPIMNAKDKMGQTFN